MDLLGTSSQTLEAKPGNLKLNPEALPHPETLNPTPQTPKPLNLSRPPPWVVKPLDLDGAERSNAFARLIAPRGPSNEQISRT